jgi:hypothetical protein
VGTVRETKNLFASAVKLGFHGCISFAQPFASPSQGARRAFGRKNKLAIGLRNEALIR